MHEYLQLYMAKIVPECTFDAYTVSKIQLDCFWEDQCGRERRTVEATWATPADLHLGSRDAFTRYLCPLFATGVAMGYVCTILLTKANNSPER